MGNPAIPSYQKPWSFQEFYEEMIEGKKNDWMIDMDEFERVKNVWGVK
jgi:hypothetical protein